MNINKNIVIEHDYTDEIVCPWCGNEDGDSLENCLGEEDIGWEYCENCEKVFYATRNILISYSTKKAFYGICPQYNIPDKVLCIDEYKDWKSTVHLCEECEIENRRKKHFELVADFENRTLLEALG